MKKFIAVFAALASLSVASAFAADPYPTRPVTIVVPLPAGGSVDGVARILAQALTDGMGQGFVVENRAGGAGGVVGATYVQKAPADGYTLLLQASIHVVTPLLNKNVPYDVVNDFKPISLVAAGPLLVSTTPKVPANNLKEFFDLVRKEPNKYTFATSGLGSAGHLATERLKREAGVDTLVIPYKGASPALNDLMSGQVQLMVDPMLSSLPLAKGGQIKALAVTSLKRAAIAPDIPTISESGMQGFDFVSWYGVWGPKDLPDDIVAKLQAAIATAVQRPDVKERYSVLGFESIGSTADYFKTYMRDEIAKYDRIIKESNIKFEQ